MTISSPAAAQSAIGDWAGTLQVTPETRLPLVVHIRQDDAGVVSGTLDSPSQGASGILLGAIALSPGKLAFTVPAVTGRYEASWDEASQTWQGQWSQNGMTWPLALAGGEAVAAAAAAQPAPPLSPDWTPPADEAVRELIAQRNAPRPGQGIVVGVLDPSGRRVVSGGSGVGAAFDGTTLFEIGSISKVFTGLILADMVNKGQVSLDDPAAKYLPAGHRMPERGRAITLRDLSTHRSGLPRMAENIGGLDDPAGPFADYTEAQLLEFLDRYSLTRDVGAQWQYSNLGVGLLGYLLGRAAGSDYPTLLRERITGPLGLGDTLIALPPSHAPRLAPAFDGYMRPTSPWDLGVHQAAGGIRSSAEDMLAFAAAVLDPASPIAPAVKTALAVRVPGANARTEQALGWVVIHPAPGREILLHDGGTGGYRSVLALEPAKATAVVALVNSAAEPSAADLGMRVLIGSPLAATPPIPPAPPPRIARTAVTLPAAELERVVGHYRLGDFVVAIALEGGTLRARNETVPGAQFLPIFAEAPLKFFWRIVDAQIRFTTDAAGQVTGAELTQGAETLTGPRIAP